MAQTKRKTDYEEFKEAKLKISEVRKTYEEGLEELKLAAAIASLRNRRGLTQTELAALIHSSPAVISRLENGNNVELKTVFKVAKALNAKIELTSVS